MGKSILDEKEGAFQESFFIPSPPMGVFRPGGEGALSEFLFIPSPPMGERVRVRGNKITFLPLSRNT
jgi:hypothetical protein